MTSFNIKQSKHNERAQVPIKGPWQSWLSDDNLFERERDRQKWCYLNILWGKMDGVSQRTLVRVRENCGAAMATNYASTRKRLTTER